MVYSIIIYCRIIVYSNKISKKIDTLLFLISYNIATILWVVCESWISCIEQILKYTYFVYTN